MKTLLDWLTGKKTYICALVCAATYFAFMRGWIDTATRDVLLLGFGTGTVIFLRKGMNK